MVKYNIIKHAALVSSPKARSLWTFCLIGFIVSLFLVIILAELLFLLTSFRICCFLLTTKALTMSLSLKKKKVLFQKPAILNNLPALTSSKVPNFQNKVHYILVRLFNVILFDIIVLINEQK